MTATAPPRPLRRVIRPLRFLCLPFHPRTVIAVASILAATVVVAMLTMVTGSYKLQPSQVLESLIGRTDRIGDLVVWGLRLPRLVAAIAIGAAFGVSGTIFQSVCRNPLASPDIIGFTTGSATGAVVSLLFLGQTRLGIAAGALVGGLATSIFVAMLNLRRGVQGDRLILTGIATSAMLTACNEYMISRAELEKAEAAKIWLFGSLNGVTWQQTGSLAIAIAILLPVGIALSPRLRIMNMGDDLAAGLGLSTTSARIQLMLIAVALTALATAIGGPINFLALAAPPIARRLCRSPDTSLVAAAAMGAFLMVSADFLAQRLLAPFQIPVGLVTSALGGCYLVYLLGQRRA